MVKNISERLGRLQSEFINMTLKAEFEQPYRPDLKDFLLIHSSSCAQLAKMLAKKRDVDVEIAAIIGLIHDIGKIYTGKKENHAKDGFLPARQLLKEIGDFSTDEIDIISNAVKNHSDKDSVGNWADEMAKDVDLLDCDLLDMKFKEESYNRRIEKVKKEMGI